MTGWPDDRMAGWPDGLVGRMAGWPVRMDGQIGAYLELSDLELNDLS